MIVITINTYIIMMPIIIINMNMSFVMMHTAMNINITMILNIAYCLL